jgi:hypothetical protein
MSVFFKGQVDVIYCKGLDNGHKSLLQCSSSLILKMIGQKRQKPKKAQNIYAKLSRLLLLYLIRPVKSVYSTSKAISVLLNLNLPLTKFWLSTFFVATSLFSKVNLTTALASYCANSSTHSKSLTVQT